jgi:hypothetical protein
LVDGERERERDRDGDRDDVEERLVLRRFDDVGDDRLRLLTSSLDDDETSDDGDTGSDWVRLMDDDDEEEEGVDGNTLRSLAGDDDRSRLRIDDDCGVTCDCSSSDDFDDTILLVSLSSLASS